MKRKQTTGLKLSGEALEHLKRTVIGSRVYTRRCILDLPRNVVAKDLGISVQELKDYETGTKEISAFLLHKLAICLDVSIDFFTQDTADQTDQDEITPAQRVSFMRPWVTMLKKFASFALNFCRLKPKTPD